MRANSPQSAAQPAALFHKFFVAFFLLLSFAVMGIAGSSSAYGDSLPNFADLAERLSPAVVNISVQRKSSPTARRPSPLSPFSPFPSPFGNPFGDLFPSPRPPSASRVVGSGFVSDAKGIVITNAHVIRDAVSIEVNFSDGSKYKAEVVGSDAKTDIAVLKIKADKPLPFVTFGDSKKARVGDWVMAVGNPYGLGGTVTSGIISAVNRDIRSGPYDNFIQTDAAINQGNSGGPLFNIQGRVVGVNTAIISSSGGSVGIGFAVPSSLAKPVVEQLLEYGETRRGWLGIHLQKVTDELAMGLSLTKARGALVSKVEPDSPADKGGIEVGDVLVKFDGAVIKNDRDLPILVARAGVGSKVQVVVIRKGKEKTLSIVLGRLEDNDVENMLSESNKKNEFLGMRLTNLTPSLRQRMGLDAKVVGVLVRDVAFGAQAARSGVRPGDIILEVAQKQVKNVKELAGIIAKHRKDKRKNVLFLMRGRDGSTRFLSLSLQGDKE